MSTRIPSNSNGMIPSTVSACAREPNLSHVVPRFFGPLLTDSGTCDHHILREISSQCPALPSAVTADGSQTKSACFIRRIASSAASPSIQSQCAVVGRIRLPNHHYSKVLSRNMVRNSTARTTGGRSRTGGCMYPA